jgi:uncharacterized protein YkwD
MSGRLATTLALVTCICALAAAAPAQGSLNWGEKRLVARINDARAAHGLRQLRVRGTLSRGAHSWSRHLMRSDSFHHARLASGTGEVLAWGTCSWFRPAQAVRMWLNSAGHRALLLRRGFRYVGTGWTSGAWRGYGCVEMAVARFR